MRRVGSAVEVSNSRDKLVWLVARDIVRLSLFKQTSPLNRLTGDGSTSSANTASFPRELILTRLQTLGLKALARCLLPILLLTPGLAQAQTAPPPSADIQSERVEQLKELLRTKKDLQASQQAMQQQLAEFDARIAALEASLGITPSQDERPQGESDATAATAAVSTAAVASPGDTLDTDPGVYEPGSLNKPGPKEVLGFPYEAGKGFVLARGPNGEVDFFTKGYIRYLNQLNLDKFYTDSFGRTIELDLRHDFQLNRLQWGLHGWLFDERFRYFWYAWTQNVSQGDPAQVVVGGNLTYKFADPLSVQAGIFSLPSTRSTAQSFPNWLRIDHRSMADEYFRGSYIQGVMAYGELTDKLDYKVAWAGNLSALGVSASQMDNCLCTYTGMLYWMPTTGEFGPGVGFGDYEEHEKLATLLEVHYTYSREDAQEQPGVNAFENSQIRLSDGTLLFGPDPFNTGGNIQKANFQMLDVGAGLKWRGWSLEGEYYMRWVDNFLLGTVNLIDPAAPPGTIPVTSLFDHGFQVYASTMLKPDYLQAYLSGSKIYGEFGDPWDLAVGLTYFPFGYKEVRMNVQALYMDRSAVGYTAVPYVVGGTGWVYTVDWGVWF